MQADYYKDKATEFELVSEVQKDNIRLTITRITETGILYNRVYYNICMVYGALRVFDSVESNMERLWYMYKAIHDAIVKGR